MIRNQTTDPVKNRKPARTTRRTKKSNVRWIISVTVAAFFLSAVFSYLSSIIFDSAGIAVSLIVLLIIILTGIVFDVIGIAVTAADEKPFHVMSSRKRRGAKRSIMLIRNAGKVSSFCNDVVGDICGIISGAAIGLILLELALSRDSNLIAGIIFTALCTALTIGGKAFGKTIAIKHSNTIMHGTGVILGILLDKKTKAKKRTPM